MDAGAATSRWAGETTYPATVENQAETPGWKRKTDEPDREHHAPSDRASRGILIRQRPNRTDLRATFDLSRLNDRSCARDYGHFGAFTPIAESEWNRAPFTEDDYVQRLGGNEVMPLDFPNVDDWDTYTVNIARL
jgi:hypothetical protein